MLINNLLKFKEEFRASHNKYKHIPPQYSAAPILTTMPQSLMSTPIPPSGKMQSLMSVKLDSYQY